MRDLLVTAPNTEVRVVPQKDGRTDIGALKEMLTDDAASLYIQPAELLRASGGRARAVCRREGSGREVHPRRESDDPRRAAERTGNSARISCAATRSRSGCRWRSAGRMRASWHAIRRSCAGCRGASRGRQRTRTATARVRADPAGARAAHPTGEGVLQHLHQPRALRADRVDLPDLHGACGASTAVAESCVSKAH